MGEWKQGDFKFKDLDFVVADGGGNINPLWSNRFCPFCKSSYVSQLTSSLRKIMDLIITSVSAITNQINNNKTKTNYMYRVYIYVDSGQCF